MAKEFHWLSAIESVRSIAAGELSSEALVRSCLERIAAREPSVAAWIHLDPDLSIA